MPSDFTHFDEAGRAHMVDISAKAETMREAVATAIVRMRPETLALIRSGGVSKGDVLAVAQVAGVMAAKATPQIIPLCHTLLLTGVDLAFELLDERDKRDKRDEREAEPGARVAIRATVRTTGKTGAEMEALTAASVAALTIYDMCKAVDRGMSIEQVQLQRKTGGKSGTFDRAPTARDDG